MNIKLLADAAPPTKIFGGGITPPSDAFNSANSTVGETSLQNLETFISNGLGLLTILAGLFFIFYFVSAGMNWITAGGDSGKIQKARDQMVQSVLGLIIIAISYGIVGLVGSFLGIQILQPGNAVLKIIHP